VRERLAKQFGKDTKVDIVWVGPYAYRSECVDVMQVDLGQSQVFFIGDSAKVVSPFGARGGNTGIADADNLAWKLAAVLQGHAAPALLHSYHPERHEAATTNVLVTNRTARFLRPADGIERLFRTAVVGLAKQHAFARALVNTGRMAVANPYGASPLSDAALGPSTSVQNVALQWVNGSAACLNDLLRWAGTRPLLLVFGDSADDLSVQHCARLRALASAGKVRIVQVALLRAQVRAREAVLDPQGLLAQACGLPAAPRHMPRQATTLGCRWALVRPDSYLAARGAALGASLVQAIARCAGARPNGVDL
jgi:3-(3-hydroxy-phenyl)propionate hydroxylase